MCGPVQAENDLGKIGGILQLFEDIFEYRPVGRVGELRGENRDNENRLFPFGMEPELGPEMPFVLL